MHDRDLERNVDQAPWSRTGLNNESWGDADPADCNAPPPAKRQMQPTESVPVPVPVKRN